jgi:ABC-2 type transport system permease protein
MIRLLAVIERDLKKFRRNPITLAMSILMPIVYLIIIGNSFQGKLQALPLVVVNQDLGPYSRQFVDNLRAIEAGPKTFKIFFVENEKEALNKVRQGTYKAALVIPPDFSRRAIMRSSPEIGIFLDNTDAISSTTLQATVNSALASISAEYVPIRDIPGLIHLRDANLYKQVDYFQSLVPGVVIMAIFLGTLTTGAFNLVMDKFLGVDESYLLTPISKLDIVGGLIISGLLVTLIIAGIILSVSILITGIAFTRIVEQLFYIVLVVVLITLSLLSLMFVILGRFDHPRIVGILSGFMNVILFFPSGAIYPIASFPPWLKAFAKVNPEAYAVHALKSVLFKGAGLATISTDLVFLAVFAALMMTIAMVTFKRTL